MRFTDELSEPKNRSALKNALADWMLGFDGNDFATGEVLQCIPWGNDLNAVLPWDTVDGEFDLAIGSRGEWCQMRIVVNNADGEHFRRRFWSEVDSKCADICKVYRRSIDKANAILAGRGVL